jgi:NAD(P)-dependent dehydrogenase (short-subunit alcohol dehydrogenase family)
MIPAPIQRPKRTFVAANNSQQEFGSRTSAYDVVAGHDLSGCTIVVTGANSGIGEWTARALASAGARVIFACRQRASGEAAVERARAAHPGCKVEFAQLDLASFASIRNFADQLDAERIDTLICNAGLYTFTWAETEEGFERMVGVCHIGHFLLARWLMPRLLASPAPRVVMVSSESHQSPPKLRFERLPLTRENFRPMVAYGQAKLCNVLMAKALQSRYGRRGLVACALHPGSFVTTGIGRNFTVLDVLIKLISPFTKSPAQGAATSVYATVHEPASALAGQFLEDCRVATCSAEANDATVAERLWLESEKWVARAGAPAWP